MERAEGRGRGNRAWRSSCLDRVPPHSPSPQNQVGRRRPKGRSTRGNHELAPTQCRAAPSGAQASCAAHARFCIRPISPRALVHPQRTPFKCVDVESRRELKIRFTLAKCWFESARGAPPPQPKVWVIESPSVPIRLPMLLPSRHRMRNKKKAPARGARRARRCRSVSRPTGTPASQAAGR